MRTMQDGGKLSCGALNTCSKLMISPLSEGWFICHCFHGTAVSLKKCTVRKYRCKEKVLKFLVILTLEGKKFQVKLTTN